MVVTRGGCDILMLSLASQLVGVLVSNLDLDRAFFIDLPRRITRRARLGKDIMFWAEADTRKERKKSERNLFLMFTHAWDSHFLHVAMRSSVSFQFSIANASLLPRNAGMICSSMVGLLLEGLRGSIVYTGH
jgi:hypothetical protein